MPEQFDPRRRRFFATAATVIAAAEFGTGGSVVAQPDEATPLAAPAVGLGSSVSFGPPEGDRCRRPRPPEMTSSAA